MCSELKGDWPQDERFRRAAHAAFEGVDAARDLARKVARKKLKPEDIDETSFGLSLQTAGLPDPDLLIRTSGEMRLSNFLLWQLAYAEIYITDLAWPEFRRPQLEAALADYASRERRFGRTGAQLKKGGGRA